MVLVLGDSGDLVAIELLILVPQSPYQMSCFSPHSFHNGPMTGPETGRMESRKVSNKLAMEELFKVWKWLDTARAWYSIV